MLFRVDKNQDGIFGVKIPQVFQRPSPKPSSHVDPDLRHLHGTVDRHHQKTATPSVGDTRYSGLSSDTSLWMVVLWNWTLATVYIDREGPGWGFPIESVRRTQPSRKAVVSIATVQLGQMNGLSGFTSSLVRNPKDLLCRTK